MGKISRLQKKFTVANFNELYNKNMGIKNLPATIEGCHVLLKEQGKLVEELSVQLKKLIQENRDLKELLNRNSNNSSQPPSQSRIKPNNNRISSGKPSGGQKGHKGHHRELLPEEEIDEIIDCRLPEKCSCGGEIIIEEGCIRHQVHELPEIKLNVTEYKLAKGECVCCGKRHIAEFPEGVTWGITGHQINGLYERIDFALPIVETRSPRVFKRVFEFYCKFRDGI